MRIDKKSGAYLDRQRDAEFNRARHDFVNRTFDDTLCTDVFYTESPAALARADGTVMRRRATYVNVKCLGCGAKMSMRLNDFKLRRNTECGMPCNAVKRAGLDLPFKARPDGWMRETDKAATALGRVTLEKALKMRPDAIPTEYLDNLSNVESPLLQMLGRKRFTDEQIADFLQIPLHQVRAEKRRQKQRIEIIHLAYLHNRQILDRAIHEEHTDAQPGINAAAINALRNAIMEGCENV